MTFGQIGRRCFSGQVREVFRPVFFSAADLTDSHIVNIGQIEIDTDRRRGLQRAEMNTKEMG